MGDDERGGHADVGTLVRSNGSAGFISPFCKRDLNKVGNGSLLLAAG